MSGQRYSEEFKREGDCVSEGYATDDLYRWICVRCFTDFQYKLKIKSE